jgi:Subtilisin inhibitor-like
MSKRFGTVVGTAIAAGALAILPATSASAADASYTLSMVHNDTGAVSTMGLTCQPPSGHPYAQQACSQLNRADGFIENIPPADGVCLLIYDPVTVRATGTWQGEPRVYEETFSNSCVANLETGGYLFNF